MPSEDSSPNADTAAARLGDSVMAVLNALDELKADNEALRMALAVMAEFIDSLVLDLMATHQWALLTKLIACRRAHTFFASLPPEVANEEIPLRDESLEVGQVVCILEYNGRSLDSHNPWHLLQSYSEVTVAHTVKGAGRRKRKRKTAEGHPPANIWFEVCSDSSATINPLGERKRNKVAAFTPFDPDAAPLNPGNGRKVGTSSSPPRFYADNLELPLRDDCLHPSLHVRKNVAPKKPAGFCRVKDADL